MPDLIKSLADVKVGAGAVLFCFKRCIDGVTKAVHLLNSGVFVTESELMVRYPLCIRNVSSDSVGE